MKKSVVTAVAAGNLTMFSGLAHADETYSQYSQVFNGCLDILSRQAGGTNSGKWRCQYRKSPSNATCPTVECGSDRDGVDESGNPKFKKVTIDCGGTEYCDIVANQPWRP